MLLFVCQSVCLSVCVSVFVYLCVCVFECVVVESERSEHTVVLSLTMFLSVCQSVCLCVEGCIQIFFLGEETIK